jgi:hypothetical protein
MRARGGRRFTRYLLARAALLAGDAVFGVPVWPRAARLGRDANVW